MKQGFEIKNSDYKPEQKMMDDDRVKPNQKLEVLGILKEALAVFSKNFRFIIFILLTTLPLFVFMVYYESLLQRTLVETSNILRQTPLYVYEINYDSIIWQNMETIFDSMTDDFVNGLVQLSFLYLVPLHLLEFCTVIVTVDLASKIGQEERTMTLKEMIQKPIYGARMGGIFVTYFQVLILSTCMLLGLIWLVTNYSVWGRSPMFSLFSAAFYGAAFVALLTKYLEWSAAWNMSIVISVLEGTYGFQALALAGLFNKDSERRGLLLMLVFFVWGLGLRSICLCVGCNERGMDLVVIAQVSLFCLGHLLKWVACVVYFHDCKKYALEKKFDVEVGREIKAVDK